MGSHPCVRLWVVCLPRTFSRHWLRGNPQLPISSPLMVALAREPSVVWAFLRGMSLLLFSPLGSWLRLPIGESCSAVYVEEYTFFSWGKVGRYLPHVLMLISWIRSPKLTTYPQKGRRVMNGVLMYRLYGHPEMRLFSSNKRFMQ